MKTLRSRGTLIRKIMARRVALMFHQNATLTLQVKKKINLNADPKIFPSI